MPDTLDQIPRLSRFLKLHFFRLRPHLLLKFRQYLLVISIQERQRRLHLSAVILLTDLPIARCLTLPDLVIQAWAILADILRQSAVACTQMIELIDQFQDILDCPCIGVWSEIFGMIPLHRMAVQKPWESFLHRHADIRITFVIRHHRVILRAVLFDQIAFQHKCFHLRACHNIFKIRDLRHHFGNLCRSSVSMSGLKILPHPAVQTHCLSHIEDIIILAVHDIDTRTFRKLFQFLLHVEYILTFLRVVAGTINIHIDSLSLLCHVSIDSCSVQVFRIKLGGIRKIPPTL